MKIILFALILFLFCSDQSLSGLAHGSEITLKQESLELHKGVVETKQLMSLDETRRLNEEDSGEKQSVNGVERKASGGGAHKGNGAHGGGNNNRHPKDNKSNASSSSVSTMMLNLLLGTLFFMF